jgi:CRP-like cAMP-binding protein
MSGTEIVLQRARSGFIAEASLESLAYHCDIVPTERSHLLAFPIPLFRTQLSENESFARFWMISLAREVRSLRAQNERLALRTARERIEHYIESEGRSGQLELRQTRKALALELGLTHEALYRALAAMVASGALAMTRADDRLVLVLKSA